MEMLKKLKEFICVHDRVYTTHYLIGEFTLINLLAVVYYFTFSAYLAVIPYLVMVICMTIIYVNYRWNSIKSYRKKQIINYFGLMHAKYYQTDDKSTHGYEAISDAFIASVLREIEAKLDDKSIFIDKQRKDVYVRVNNVSYIIEFMQPFNLFINNLYAGYNKNLVIPPMINCIYIIHKKTTTVKIQTVMELLSCSDIHEITPDHLTVLDMYTI